MTKKEYERQRIKFKKQNQHVFDRAAEAYDLTIENRELKEKILELEATLLQYQEWNERLLDYVNLSEKDQKIMLSEVNVKNLSVFLNQLIEDMKPLSLVIEKKFR